MTRIVDLRPKLSDPPVQCEVTTDEMGMAYNIHYSRYRKEKAQRSGKHLGQCMKQSKYKIDGRCLCAFHAGIEAIKILMGKD